MSSNETNSNVKIEPKSDNYFALKMETFKIQSEILSKKNEKM